MLKPQFKATRVTQAIRAASEQIEDMTPIFQDVVEYMIGATRKRFATGTAPDGSPWAPKKQTTLDRYKRLGYGRLPKPLVGASKRLGREIFGQATATGAVIGSALIYSRVMQEGAGKGEFGADRRGRPIPWGNIPARVFLGISGDDEAAILDIIDEHLEGKLDAQD